MSAARRLAIVAAGIVATVAVFIVLRGGGDEEAAAPPPAAATTTVTTSRETPRPGRARRPPRKAENSPVVARIAVRRGRVAGGVKRVTAKKGQRIVLAVSADLSDHVHVHGYDIFRDVSLDSPARISFRARIAGRFEVELEERGILIARLEVSP